MNYFNKAVYQPSHKSTYKSTHKSTLGYLIGALCVSSLMLGCASEQPTQVNAPSPSISSSTGTPNYPATTLPAVPPEVIALAGVDLRRLEDLAYWTGLFEEYKAKTGSYPLQDKITDQSIMVNITSPAQEAALNKERGSGFYSSFKKMNTDTLLQTLSEGLGQPIDKRFDPIAAPYTGAIGYYYFATEDGYLLWTVCSLCEITTISTYLMNGQDITLNIASEGMIDKVTKAQTRESMLNNPIYKRWINEFTILSRSDLN